MLAQYGPVPEISITFDPATRCYGFSTRLPGMRPHWAIDTFESLEAVMHWADPWKERVWEEPSEGDDSRILVSREKKPGGDLSSYRKGTSNFSILSQNALCATLS